MELDKHFLNLAGEYRVCSELLKRGLFATITYGNQKGADIYAIGSNRKAAVIEVKASHSTRFVTSFYQKYKNELAPHPTFWVLYSLRERAGAFSEHFFVLSHEEMAIVQARRVPATASLQYAERVAALSRGVDNLLVEQVTEHEDAWVKIVRYCSDTA
jgi:hypothetical protein